MSRKTIICSVCKEKKPEVAKGLCGACYYKQYKKIIKCKKCGELKIHHAKGLCNKCYLKQNLIKCKKCGEEKPHKAFGLCANCYQKQNLKVCSVCGELKPHHAFKLCITCYSHKKGLHKPIHLNKSCAQYLGVHIAEKVLSKVFKNVKEMPYGNKGYDFICSKGMKIDVKSGVLKFDKSRPNYKGYWNFHINKNSIPDHFLCIAFDSRTSLTPLHLWLIPSEKVSHLIGLGISKNQTHKWTEYELPLEKVITCCNTLKNK